MDRVDLAVMRTSQLPRDWNEAWRMVCADVDAYKRRQRNERQEKARKLQRLYQEYGPQAASS